MKPKKRNTSRRATSSEYSFTVFFEPAAEGGYVVTCPALPGLVTEGDSLAEAREWPGTPFAPISKAYVRMERQFRAIRNLLQSR